MSDIEIARQIAVKINEAELAMAQINALATDEFRAGMDPDTLAKAERLLDHGIRDMDKLHRALLEAVKSNPVVAPAFGGGK